MGSEDQQLQVAVQEKDSNFRPHSSKAEASLSNLDLA